MTQVERLIADLKNVGTRISVSPTTGKFTSYVDWECLARHVLRRQRAARGRTILWCGVGGKKRCDVMGVCDSRVMTEAEIHGTDYRLARVVAVPKKGARR